MHVIPLKRNGSIQNVGFLILTYARANPLFAGLSVEEVSIALAAGDYLSRSSGSFDAKV
ncbi:MULTISPECIES: hypothetical protein [unclassified Bradyrhizobium]|uniref:hypothetical protein n=1 Tax=unclassified Bradyrhizobium TaxID=2631580 RepID=UPI001FF72EA6|nr:MULTISPECIES: hypothetical protein [unclassified Bradyrhizobium]MCK1538685.1 hypothetical protein [Bradyrhizobium sp. 176]MCK1558627.1 hypothetical protein [Bradyrhizobium sp. 171]